MLQHQMWLHNFKIEQIITESSFLQNSATNTLGLVFIVGILICVIPLIIIALTLSVVAFGTKSLPSDFTGFA